MSSVALKPTFNDQDDQIAKPGGTLSFGPPLANTKGASRAAPSTEEIEVRKSIPLPASKTALRTLTPPAPYGEYFKPIKNWEGVVEEVRDQTFVATMRDTDLPSDRGNEQFEIDLEDVDPGDRDLIRQGSIFYFTVGYRIVRGGTRIKGTQIVFRRMPLWSKNDIQRAEARAKRFLEIMAGE